MGMRLSYLAGLALAATVMSGPAKAGPSFDCAYASLPTEITICQNPFLGDLDAQMAARYFTLVNRAPYRLARKIRNQQTSWLRARNACGFRVRCIARRYNNQIARLDNWARHPALS